MTASSTQPTFWGTVGVLLGAARQRANGRKERARQLLQQRSNYRASDWGAIGFRLTAIVLAVVNVLAAVALKQAVSSSQRVEAEHRGKFVVSRSFFEAAKAEADYENSPKSQRCYLLHAKTSCYETTDQAPPAPDYSSEATEVADSQGGGRAVIEQRLRDEVTKHGSQNLVARDDAIRGLTELASIGRFPAMMGSLVLLWWGLMLVCQGEGLEMDLQRRRHPMWEWLFSHPAPPAAIFLAELLSPIAANPMYWGGPLFAGVAYGLVYGPGLGFAAILLVGVPLTVAAACLGKALEIGIVLRFPPRSRGAMIGIMSWFGYASMMLFFVGMLAVPRIVEVAGKFLFPLTAVPWPWLGLFLGQTMDGSFSFVAGTMDSWILATLVIAAAVSFSIWGTKKGLAGNFGHSDLAPKASGAPGAQFGREPLYRKEFLWFVRDRSAVVQAILIPLTVAGFQVFNLRGVLSAAQGAWNYLCGAAILFGTYFLWVLGPKSLSSEGSALWIALTWPRGLENLLKAKAWLWSLISTGLVVLVLGYAAFLFPHEIWKIALVGIAWFFFGRSMAEKSVTLVTVTSSSGEPEKIPSSRRWAAQLGMLTFAIGVLTQQWHIAAMGIVYSYVTAAAMWQNFRARLPYLYDPWSEKLPDPPTLMHAMIAISILIEAGAALTGVLLIFVGRENIGIAMAFSYGIASLAVCLGVAFFLDGRGVSNRELWRWCARAESGGDQQPDSGRFERSQNLVLGLAAGIAAGIALGLFAHGYEAILRYLPATSELMRKSQDEMSKIPNLRISFAVMAVGFAPFAEEYLFRGLLYKALDREWGGWRAVIGSAAFFAIYHPVLSWVPVFLLGASNAWLFKKSGRLLPAVALHMTYNAVVLLF